MKYVRLGNTGLKVSRICLGTMSYGQPPTDGQHWELDEEQSRPYYERALELGINFFDTANVYSQGVSETVLGRAMRDLAVQREEVVIATKVYFPMGATPNDRGLSRKHILSSIDASLKRLGMDYVDLYQIHRWDYETPIEETMKALNDVVRSGKARYIGASAMHAWQFTKALYTADLRGWTLDPDGSKRAEVVKTAPVIAAGGDSKPFKTEAALKAAMKKRGATAKDFEVKQAQGGYIAVPRTATLPTTEVTHLENGRIAPAKPEIIRESIAKSAANTPLDVKEAKAKLLAMIDDAAKKAKSLDDMGMRREAIKKDGRIERYEIQARPPHGYGWVGLSSEELAAKIGYVTLDVPGDTARRPRATSST